MKISVHALVKNEEDFIWYAINSVIDCVDEVVVWDNGSLDSTVRIIKSIKNTKIKFKEAVGIRPETARRKMLEETDSDWIFILDGDEIWWQDAVSSLVNRLSHIKEDIIVVPNYMLIGDIFHYQESAAGKYKIGNRVGHYNIRVVRKTPGLHIEGIYPNEAFVNREGIKVQDLSSDRVLFLDKPYLHASFLRKIKYENGVEFPKDFYYPEVFFRTRPEIVPSVWDTPSSGFKFRAFFETPIRKVYRRTLMKNKEHGY